MLHSFFFFFFSNTDTGDWAQHLCTEQFFYTFIFEWRSSSCPGWAQTWTPSASTPTVLALQACTVILGFSDRFSKKSYRYFSKSLRHSCTDWEYLIDTLNLKKFNTKCQVFEKKKFQYNKRSLAFSSIISMVVLTKEFYFRCIHIIL